MKKISKKTKLELYNLLKKEPNAFGDIDTVNDDNIISFLEEIWDLSAMKSIDNRYKNASGEFFQHLINNDDYSYDYLFKERLDLFENEEVFIKFIETIISPKFRNSEDEITRYLILINPYLEKHDLSLFLDNYDNEERPIYRIDIKDDSKPLDLKNNIILF